MNGNMGSLCRSEMFSIIRHVDFFSKSSSMIGTFLLSTVPVIDIVGVAVGVSVGGFVLLILIIVACVCQAQEKVCCL